ncbi:poly(A) RNA polymerase gld-2 homolog B [Drosophila innubila]|uniref:poly(A) RNA polymerase gld-2 homolog B n=1 Tax=Drosophila innubila TaxID=198719 RepID=UPI00148B5F23|nr:poly(A) RNA polymerase gld-2 homolog B [Drosophila innubila]
MYTTRAEMKIFATNVVDSGADGVGVAAAAAATTAAQQQQQQLQQQREFRCGAQVKYNKYNNNNNSNNKNANMLRQAKYNNANNSSSNNHNNNNNSDNKNAKRQHQQQQQQQQQSQQQHMHYNNNNNNVHNFARKKYFGNNTTNNNSNSYNCNQAQQQQSAYYQQQQQQHQIGASAATAKLTNNNSNNSNNNNLMIKNQNIIEDINCKLSNDSNNNNSDSNNNNSNNCAPKSQTKTMSNHNIANSNNNNNKKRNSLSSTTESSISSSYYHSCSESSSIQAAATRNNNNAENERQQQQQQQSTPSAMEVAVASKHPPSNTMGQQNNSNSGKGQRSRQQPLCFWKTSYPQQPTLQQKEQQLEAALATQKETELAMAAATTAATTVDQQPHYYQYYYSQPKQLTIASFLQKELLPVGDKVNQQQQKQHQQHQQQQQPQQQQQQSGGYQQRYRNVNYNYNSYQQHSHTHTHQHQQQQQQQQQHHQNHNNHNNTHRHNTHFRHNKKMHFNSSSNSNNSSTPTAQKSIEILPTSNFNASHRRMPNAAAVGNNCSVAGKNEFYPIQQHPHPYHLLPGKEHQNFYNLTYVNVDLDVPPPTMTMATSAAAAAAATTAIVAGIKTMPSLVLKPLATANGAAVSPTPTPPIKSSTITQSDVAKATATVAVASVTATAAATASKNMFLQPAPSLQLLGPGMLSPIALSPDAVATTPANMISCAQLDEAITAAAANNNTGNSHTCGKNVELAAVMPVTSPNYAALPFLIQQQQQPQQQQKPQQQLLFQNNKTQQQQQQVFFGFGDGYNNAPAAWSHANSPCYSTAYGPSCSSISSGSAHSRIQGHRPGAVSPALSNCSLASESQWSSRSRLTPTEVLSVSPTPTATPTATGTGQQLSPHPLTGSPVVGGNINGLHAMLPFSVPPPSTHNMPVGGGYQHFCGPNCGCNGSTSWPASWYEVVLPPDRYLDHARNVELAMQPEQLLCHCKYDNLSLDIWKRFRGAQQTQARFKLKMRLWRYLFIWINQPMFSRYRICLVGSTITGFGTDSSDIDMCLLPEQPSHHQQQHHYHNELRTEALMTLNLFHTVLKEMEAFQDFNLIEARVPILRFKDRINGIEVDLNYNNCVGIKNTYLLQLYAQLDWRTRPLVVIVKLWAQYHDINDAKRMTVSSYSLVLMVLHYLQYGCVPHVLPCLQALYPEKFNLGQQDCLDLDLIEPIEPYQTHNTQTLGEHLLGFFKYYSNFDYRNNAISIRTGGVLPVTSCRVAKSPKNDIHQWKELSIEEPFDLSNTARSVYDNATFERVKATFVHSARRLEHTLDLASIFTPIHHTQRMPMHQSNMHPHSHPSHTNHSHSHPHPHPNPHQHQHLMHSRNTAPTVPSKMITAGSFATAATNLV